MRACSTLPHSGHGYVGPAEVMVLYYLDKNIRDYIVIKRAPCSSLRGRESESQVHYRASRLPSSAGGYQITVHYLYTVNN